jgi:hypothetical protein
MVSMPHLVDVGGGVWYRMDVLGLGQLTERQANQNAQETYSELHFTPFDLKLDHGRPLNQTSREPMRAQTLL